MTMMTAGELLGVYGDTSHDLLINNTTSSTLLDPFCWDLYTSTPLFSSNIYDHHANNTSNNVLDLPYYNSSCYISSHELSTFPDHQIFSVPDHDLVNHDYSYYPNSKRQKSCCSSSDVGYCNPDFLLNCFKGFPPSAANASVDYYLKEPDLLLSEINDHQMQKKPLLQAYCEVYDVEKSKRVQVNTNNKGDEGMSAQSVAARQRRRRITEKTQELARLIPGGSKMNTADMFHSAFKYVKFLQSQLGILQIMASLDHHQESKDDKASPTNIIVKGEKQLQVLLASSVVQETLSSEEKCLVPEELVETLARDRETIPMDNSLNSDRITDRHL